MKILFHPDETDNLPAKESTLSFPPYERLKGTYFSNGMDDAIKYATFVESMAPILQTSTYMLEQLMSGSIHISLSNGNCLEIKFNCMLGGVVIMI